MAEFLDVANGLLKSGRAQEKEAAFKTVFSVVGGLQAVHSKAQLDLTNIESVFTALELGKIIQTVPGLKPGEITGAIDALKTLIVRTLEVSIGFPTRGTTIGAPKPYDDFAKLLGYLREKARPAYSVSVITFNYDIAVDVALFRANLGPDYMLDPTSGAAGHVALMKLHGSLNWASVTEREEVRPLHLKDYFQHYRAQGLQDTSTTFLAIGSEHLAKYFEDTENL